MLKTSPRIYTIIGMSDPTKVPDVYLSNPRPFVFVLIDPREKVPSAKLADNFDADWKARANFDALVKQIRQDLKEKGTDHTHELLEALEAKGFVIVDQVEYEYDNDRTLVVGGDL